jgi:hypothetical protein
MPGSTLQPASSRDEVTEHETNKVHNTIDAELHAGERIVVSTPVLGVIESGVLNVQSVRGVSEKWDIGIVNGATAMVSAHSAAFRHT